MTLPLSDRALNLLFTFGDPVLDGTDLVPPGFRDEVRSRGLLEVAARPRRLRPFINAVAEATYARNIDVLPGSIPPVPAGRVPLDLDCLERAPAVFGRYGNEIAAALLLAALPQAYTARWGSQVLVATGGMTQSLQRRSAGTAQFLAVVTQRPATPDRVDALWNPTYPYPWPPALPYPPPWRMCTVLRMYHSAIRADLQARGLPDEYAANGWCPLNQQELLGTLLSFTITVFEVLERFGVTWSNSDQAAYLHLWDVIGAYLGIGSPEAIARLDPLDQQRVRDWPGLRPPSTRASRALLEGIHARAWPRAAPNEASPFDTREGRLLVRALLDLLVDAMPPAEKSWPLAVMRQLSPQLVNERLALGVPGVVMGSLKIMPGRRVTIDRFTDVVKPNLLNARVTREMANEVARRAVIQFVKEGFVIPGLEQWTDGFVESRA